MPRYFIGIDVSTTASKALVMDERGDVVAVASHDHALSTPRPLWSEQDPHDWWHAASASLRAVTTQIDPADVGAIGLTGQMHGLTPLDSEGRPVRPAMLWNDGRSGAQCAAITEKVGTPRLYELIGSILLAGFTAPKLLWVRENEPEAYARIAHILLPKDYVRYRLSGAFVSDVADASGFGLMDIATRDWSDELLAAYDFPRALLPQLVESQQVCAHVSAEAAAETGLRAGTPIVGGAGDQPAGGVGSGIVAPGQVSLSIGTSGVAYAINGSYQPEPNGRLHTFCGPIPGTWFGMGVMLSAAGGLRWLRDTFASNYAYDNLMEQAATVPRGANGLLFAPYLTGERNPHPDPLARGAFVGLTLRHTLPHFVRAVLEGVSFGMRDQLERFRAQGIVPTHAVISGGAAKSAVWRQLTADIMGVPMVTVNTTEGAAFGAAILAAVGAGAFPDVPTACAELVRAVDTTDPTAEGMADYERLYPLFRGLYPALAESFHGLAQFEG